MVLGLFYLLLVDTQRKLEQRSEMNFLKPSLLVAQSVNHQLGVIRQLRKQLQAGGWSVKYLRL